MNDMPRMPGQDERPEVLPCGRDPLDVVDRARSGRSTEHERGCPYCRAVIASAGPADRAAAALAESERGTAVPDSLLPDVMRTVWSDLRHARMIPLRIDAGRATAFIADHAVAALVENALDDLPELQIHTCRVTIGATPPPDAGGAVGAVGSVDAVEDGPRLTVAVTAAAAYGSEVRRAADDARTLVRRTIDEQLGWTTDTVDVAIVDVYLTSGRPA